VQALKVSHYPMQDTKPTNAYTLYIPTPVRYSKGDVAELRAEVEALKANMGGGGMGKGVGNGKPAAHPAIHPQHTEATVV